MRSIFLSVFPHVGHMTIDAGHSGIGMNAKLPTFKIRVLRFQHNRAAVRVRPVAFKSAGRAALTIKEFADIFFTGEKNF